MCLITSLSSVLAQVAIIRGALDIKISDWLVWPLVGNIIGWMLSLLVVIFVYFLFQLSDISFTDEALVLEKLYAAPLPVAALLGMLGGAVIGLPPGIFSGLAYSWLFRPVYNAKQLVESNVMGWCIGMGLVFASLLIVYVIIARAMTSIFMN